MKKTHTTKKMAVLLVLLAAAWAWAAMPPESGQESHMGHDHSGPGLESDDHEGHDHEEGAHEDHDASSAAHTKLTKEQLPAALAAIDKATKAVQFGDKKTALAELARLHDMVLAVQKALESHTQPAFVNNRCPIMGNAIDPSKVTSALTRTYQGKKLALCSEACIRKWDKLTETQKEAKLKVLIPSQAKDDPDDGEDHSGHVH